MPHVLLRPETAAMLAKTISGRGGFQSLMRRIQLGLRGRALDIAEADLDALIQSVRGPSIGGFQRRARDIVADAVVDRLRADGFRMRNDPDAGPRGIVVPFEPRHVDEHQLGLFSEDDQ